MSPSPQLAPQNENAEPDPRGGPCTEAGKSASSRNATTYGLFTQRDFIRPGEEEDYAQDKTDLAQALAPSGPLECNLVDEIHRATWRLRRCGEVEASFLLSLAGPGATFMPDPMQDDSTAKLQLSIDRARSQAHRLLHKCTAELRRLQTDRHYRNESFEAGTDISDHGICDWRLIFKALQQDIAARARNKSLTEEAEFNAMLNAPIPPPAGSGSFCKTDPSPAQTPRNAECPCKSGLKFKRCCGKNAPAVLQAA